MSSTLVIVACGQQKVWHKQPLLGAVPARDAYTGPPFVLNRQYAERFGDAWVILSAKYGFIPPDFLIPEAYEVTFKKQATGPVTMPALREQVRNQGLEDFTEAVGLGGVEYRLAIEAAFEGSGVALRFPFAGLTLGYSLQAVKRALGT